jgi:hypothetical protein
MSYRFIDANGLLVMTNSYKSELGRLKADPFVKSGIETVERFINEQPTADVIPIPKDATNGDMIKAVFPGCEDWKATIKPATGEAHDTHFVELPNNMTINKFDESWWNAPYKEAEE